jgi:hypothetical protein
MKQFLKTHPRMIGASTLLAGLVVMGLAVPSIGSTGKTAMLGSKQDGSMGTAVACPWTFQNGDPTSQTTAISSVEEIMQKAGYSTIPGQVARTAWNANGRPQSRFRNMPTSATLEAYGKAVHADRIYYGSVSWHTRSIWVDLGPKTVSTATVDVYVFDVAADKVVYRSRGIEGRSDETENAYKVAADILITPLVTVVSGGPATPREQRAVQIALGRAYHSWIKPGSTK